MPPALGYQPRTTAANLLLIRLTVIVPPPYVTASTPLTGRPWDYTRLACIGRLRNAHGSLTGLEYPYGRWLSTHLSLGCPSLWPQAAICAARFELAASPIRTECATRLRYTQFKHSWLTTCTNKRCACSWPLPKWPKNQYRLRDSNPHAHYRHQILSLACLPFQQDGIIQSHKGK